MHKYETRAKLAVIVAYSAIVFVPAALAGEVSEGLAWSRTDEHTAIERTVTDPLDKYRGVKKLDDHELKDLLKLIGFEGRSLKIAWAVAKKESNGRPLAHNDNPNTGDNSYGIFQINMIGTLGEDRREKFGLTKNSDLLDPVTNAEIAFHMSAKGTNFGSWGWGADAYDGTPEEPKITEWMTKFPQQ